MIRKWSLNIKNGRGLQNYYKMTKNFKKYLKCRDVKSYHFSDRHLHTINNQGNDRDLPSSNRRSALIALFFCVYTV